MRFRKDTKINSAYLEVDDNKENKGGGKEVVNVRPSRSVEGLLKSTELVGSSDEEMEESNDRSFEFRSLVSLDSDGGERFPDNSLANVGSDEEGDTRSESVTLLEKLVEEEDNDTSNSELDDDKDSVTSTEITNFTVHTTPNVSNSLTQSNDQTQNY